MFNENWYNQSQCDELSKVCKQIPTTDGLIIEIGCWEGKSTTFIANSIYPRILTCNDTWQGNLEEEKITGVPHITVSIAKERDVYSTFLRNMEMLTGGNFIVVKRDCIEWLSTISKPIVFCHIDASHEYESVKKTIELLLPNVVPGGILCGDDFLSANIRRTDLHGGVERAVRELLPGFTNINNLWVWIKPTQTPFEEQCA